MGVVSGGARWDPNNFSERIGQGSCRDVTIGRSIFFTEGSENETGLMGIGPADMISGDEIYMFKGGQVLYVLRRDQVLEDLCATTLDCTGDAHHTLHLRAGDKSMCFVGECLMLGLMDGEILKMMESKGDRKRPAALQSMDQDFQKVYVF